MKYELIAKGQCEGQRFTMSPCVEIGDIVRDTVSGQISVVETPAFVHEYYGGNIWDEDLWRWQGGFPPPPDVSFTDEELVILQAVSELRVGPSYLDD